MMKKVFGHVILGGSQGIYLSALNVARSCAHLKPVVMSKHFDSAYYSNAAKLKFKNSGFAALHYLLVGEAKGLKPSLRFDPVYYRDVHPDVRPLSCTMLMHYIRHGFAEGRPATDGREESVISEDKALNTAPKPVRRKHADWRVLLGQLKHALSHLSNVARSCAHLKPILRSNHFDAAYYSKAAGVNFASPKLAALHYLLVGEPNGLKPSAHFDPVYYLEAHPDLQNLPYSLLLHYVRYGFGEGRPGAGGVDEGFTAGRKVFDPACETAIVVVHEMSRTGAPILGLNLAAQLSESMNVIVVAARRGALIDSFVDACVGVVSPLEGRLSGHPGLLARGIVTPLMERYGAAFAIVNSVEVAPFAAACSLVDLPCVSLVHEFSDYVFPKTKITDVILGSQRVIFSSQMTERTFQQYWEFGGSLAHTGVIPQGKCEPPDSEGSDVASGRVERLRPAKGALVIGCGQVQMRKGTDFFVAAATSVIKELGPEAVKFVWVGGGYHPETDDYCRWLKSQLDRSDLGDAFEFVDELGAADLHALYNAADVMLLSSRLDPFPNVAIDAMHAGLPIVSFENASGVAEYLSRVPVLSETVVAHMDVAAATRQIVSLLTDKARHERVSSELLRLARTKFVFADYAQKILAEVAAAKDILAQEHADVETLEASDLFRGDYAGSDDMPAERTRRIRRYVRSSSAGCFAAEPRIVAGLNMQVYAQCHGVSGVNPLADWLRKGKPSGPWLRKVEALQGPAAESSLRILVHLHLHYPEMLEGILGALAVNATQPDLIVTVSSKEAFADLSEKARPYGTRIRVLQVENRGRDIGPMLTGLKTDLSSYDLIWHFHGKKSLHIGGDDFVSKWRVFLTENLLGGRHPALDIIAGMFEKDERLGLVFPEDPFICGWGENRAFASPVAARLGVDLPPVVEFPVGNMFAARISAIKPLFEAGFTPRDFPAEPIGRDGTVLHALERLTPAVCESRGYRWQTTSVDGIIR